MAATNSSKRLSKWLTDGRFDPLKFWAFVTQSDGCWEWAGLIAGNGYGVVDTTKGNGVPDRSAHRVSWKLTFGEIPNGLCVLHRCDNRRCCRPDHLFLGTRGDNSTDAALKGRSRTGTQKLNPEQVRQIRALRGVKPTMAVAAQFGVSRSVIQRVWYRKHWKWVA